MTEKTEVKSRENPGRWGEVIGAKVDRKIAAMKNPGQGAWFGLGMMGLIGWSVVVPILLGLALGIWIDGHYPGNHSWTLMLLAVGMSIGCLNAWHWVAKEGREMGDDHDE